MRLHNRQIKAAFWTDPDLLQWPREKRWFYIGLVQLADDSGCLEDSPFAFKIHLFPSPLDADITIETITAWRDELIAEGKLIPYEVEGKRYLFIANFHKHQTPDYPTPPSRASIPLPPWVQWVEEGEKKRKGRYVVSDIPRGFPGNSQGNPGETPPINITGTVTGTGNITGTVTGTETITKTGKGSGEDPRDPVDRATEADPPPAVDTPNSQQEGQNQPEHAAQASNEAQGTPERRKRASVEYPPDFEEFWRVYPRHVAKLAALEKWRARVREGVPPDKLIQAAKNYALYCQQMDKDDEFIMHAATFLGPKRRYEDFLNGVPGKAKLLHISANTRRALNLVAKYEQGGG
ncbi:MAG TPA: hypothetical protein GXX40_05570 [Firmicutes bacterium]|nr:hypothetical protein [Bacillota bacterium]